jgi:nicotinate-nucleotide adenylyltransferase
MTDLINILLPPTKIRLNIGLFFGSFNPPHIGHMAIANYLVEFAGLNQLWFVVSPQNPLKEQSSLLKEYDRLELVRQAVEGDLRFRVSDVEFRMPKPSYTINTLTYLKDKFPDHTFTLIIGSDNLENFQQWKDYGTILGNYRIIVYPRPGFSGESVPGHNNIRLIEAPQMEISSTFIRDSIRAGKDVRYFVTAPVWEYMDKMNYYRNMPKG